MIFLICMSNQHELWIRFCKERDPSHMVIDLFTHSCWIVIDAIVRLFSGILFMYLCTSIPFHSFTNPYQIVATVCELSQPFINCHCHESHLIQFTCLFCFCNLDLEGLWTMWNNYNIHKWERIDEAHKDKLPLDDHANVGEINLCMYSCMYVYSQKLLSYVLSIWTSFFGYIFVAPSFLPNLITYQKPTLRSYLNRIEILMISILRKSYVACIYIYIYKIHLSKVRIV